MINRDREYLQGGATSATKPGTRQFPYLASPNTELQTVVDSVDLSAAPDQVWALIGQFGGAWHPLIARIAVTGTGIGQLRTIETIDGKQIIERLEAMDDSQRFYRYSDDQRHPRLGLRRDTRRQGEREPAAPSSGACSFGRMANPPHRQDHRSHSAENRPRSPQEALRLNGMIESLDLAMDFAPATAGDIAAINLDSARRQSWSRFWRAPERPGIAENIVEQELLTAQFVGDLTAFDRLESSWISSRAPIRKAAQTRLVAAQVACATHRFAEARVNLAQAVARGAPSDACRAPFAKPPSGHRK